MLSVLFVLFVLSLGFGACLAFLYLLGFVLFPAAKLINPDPFFSFDAYTAAPVKPILADNDPAAYLDADPIDTNEDNFAHYLLTETISFLPVPFIGAAILLPLAYALGFSLA